jgi:hypothetical protein
VQALREFESHTFRQKYDLGPFSSAPETPMDEIQLTVTGKGDELQEACKCCGRPVYTGSSDIESDKNLIGFYWYHWSEGHEGRFSVGIAEFDSSEELIEGVIVVSASLDEKKENVSYTVLEPNESPWPFTKFGGVLTRAQALEIRDTKKLFRLVDAVTHQEMRIADRLKSSFLAS